MFSPEQFLDSQRLLYYKQPFWNTRSPVEETWSIISRSATRSNPRSIFIKWHVTRSSELVFVHLIGRMQKAVSHSFRTIKCDNSMTLSISIYPRLCKSSQAWMSSGCALLLTLTTTVYQQFRPISCLYNSNSMIGCIRYISNKRKKKTVVLSIGEDRRLCMSSGQSHQISSLNACRFRQST
jgi:hypothetical protein